MQEGLIQLLAGRRGHFQLESGYHSEQWFELDRLLEQREALRPYIIELARRIASYDVEVVCGPMTGGAKLAELIAGELDVEYLYADRFEPQHSVHLFPVKYQLPPMLRGQAHGRTIAIVDDAISAGSAVRGTYADLLSCGAKPVVLGALVVFGENGACFAADHHLALESITRLKFEIWDSAECPLCKTGVPLEKVSDPA